MERSKISIRLDNDILQWIDASKEQFGRDQSERIRTVLRAGYDRLKKDHAWISSELPQITPLTEDPTWLINRGYEVTKRMYELAEKYDKLVRRFGRLDHRIYTAEKAMEGLQSTESSHEK